MEILNAQKGQKIVKRKDKVKAWYLIRKGCVMQKFGFAEMQLGPNAIAGISETDWYACDYIALEDTSLISIPCGSTEEIKNFLESDERFRGLFYGR